MDLTEAGPNDGFPVPKRMLRNFHSDVWLKEKKEAKVAAGLLQKRPDTGKAFATRRLKQWKTLPREVLQFQSLKVFKAFQVQGLGSWV